MSAVLLTACVFTAGCSESPCGSCPDGCGQADAVEGAGESMPDLDGQEEETCPAGTVDCGGVCVNTDTSHEHCGTCGNACEAVEVCYDRHCLIECPAGLEDCFGSCVDLRTSGGHCGSCGNGCSSAELCLEGSCRLMLKIRSVQTGTATLSGTSVNVDLPEIDASRSFLVFSASPDVDNATCGFVRGLIASSTRLVFTRDNRYGDCSATFEVRWYVAEFTGGVTVQRGTQDQGGDVTIAAVDLAVSFPIISYTNEGSNIADDDFVRARLTGETTLSLTGGGRNTVIEWQVVSIDDTTVQAGDLSFGAADTQLSATVDAVDPAMSWLVYSYTSSGGTPDGNLGEKLIQGLLTDATTVSFDRVLTGSSHELTYYLVQFSDWTAVQHGSQRFQDTGDETVVLTEVDVSTTLAAGGHVMMVGKCDETGNNHLGRGWFRLDLVDPVTMAIHRSRGNGSAALGWFVIDFSGLRP